MNTKMKHSNQSSLYQEYVKKEAEMAALKKIDKKLRHKASAMCSCGRKFQRTVSEHQRRCLFCLRDKKHSNKN